MSLLDEIEARAAGGGGAVLGRILGDCHAAISCGRIAGRTSSTSTIV